MPLRISKISEPPRGRLLYSDAACERYKEKRKRVRESKQQREAVP